MSKFIFILSVFLTSNSFAGGITYKKIQPLLKKRCDSCHSFMVDKNWQKYEDVLAKKDSLIDRVCEKKNMPPAGLPIKNLERALICNWLKNGVQK